MHFIQLVHYINATEKHFCCFCLLQEKIKYISDAENNNLTISYGKIQVDGFPYLVLSNLKRFSLQ